MAELMHRAHRTKTQVPQQRRLEFIERLSSDVPLGGSSAIFKSEHSNSDFSCLKCRGPLLARAGRAMRTPILGGHRPGRVPIMEQLAPLLLGSRWIESASLKPIFGPFRPNYGPFKRKLEAQTVSDT